MKLRSQFNAWTLKPTVMLWCKYNPTCAVGRPCGTKIPTTHASHVLVALRHCITALLLMLPRHFTLKCTQNMHSA
jgi:hypothetical protein